MSMLHKPFWQDLGGKPVTGSKPVTVVMQSGRMTPQRHTEIQQIYTRFSLAKLASVGDFFVFNRVLTDGTRVRMESMQGQDRVFVWANDAQQTNDQWEYGWCLVPGDEQSPQGYVRKPGVASGSLLGQDFTKPVGDAPKVFTYVDGRSGKHHICDSRVGGGRIWRGPKDKSLVLTYEDDTVYVEGKQCKLDFFFEQGTRTAIDGAAIAMRGAEKWLVFITQSVKSSGLVVGTIKLADLKAVNRTFVECGAAVESGGGVVAPVVDWNFSPDGLKAIALGGVPVLGGSVPGSLDHIYRLELKTINGTTPFFVNPSTEKQADIGVKRVSSNFNPEKATRNLHWEGWGSFYARLDRNYYAAHNHQVDGQLGQAREFTDMDLNAVNPVIAPEGHGETPFQAPAFYDPIMSIGAYSTKNGQDNVLFLSDDNTQELPAHAPVVIPKTAFLFDDGDVPEAGINYFRELVRDSDRPGENVNVPPWMDDNQVAARPPGASGWYVQSYRATNWIKNIFEYSFQPYYGASFEDAAANGVSLSRYVRCKVQFMGLVVKYATSVGSTETFDSLQQLASHFDMRWGGVALSSTSLGLSINAYYGALTAKSDYPRLTDAAHHLSSLSDNLVDRRQVHQLISDDAALGPHRLFNLRGGALEPVDAVPEHSGDGYETEWISFRDTKANMVDAHGNVGPKTIATYAESNLTGRYKPFGLAADFYATPKFKNHYTTSWHFTCEVSLTGRCLLAAGYDREGKERFIYFEGDAARALRYTASVTADDDAWPSRSVSFSGEVGCVLKVGDKEVGKTSYAVADTFASPMEENNARWWSHSGAGPAITVQNLMVFDLDVDLGHVLCREVKEVFSATGEPVQARPTVYALTYRDFLHTPTAVHELGQSRTYKAGDRVLDDAVRYFASTAVKLSNTCPHFGMDGQLELAGVELYRSDDLRFYEKLLPLVPSGQRNPPANAYGWDDANFAPIWAQDALFLYPGRDGTPFHYTGTVLHRTTFTHLELEMKKTGAHAVAPRSTLQLRSFSDEAWMVCYCQEQYIAAADKKAMQARYFIKCGKKAPVKEVDSATAFPFLLADSPSFLRVGFYFGLKP